MRAEHLIVAKCLKQSFWVSLHCYLFFKSTHCSSIETYYFLEWLKHCSRCVFTVCVFTAVCVHFGWDKCRTQIPSMGHHTWPYVTSPIQPDFRKLLELYGIVWLLTIPMSLSLCVYFLFWPALTSHRIQNLHHSDVCSEGSQTQSCAETSIKQTRGKRSSFVSQCR